MTQLLVKIAADFSTTLVSKTAVGATSATLTSGLDLDGVQLPTGTYGFTIDRNNAQKEHFTATLTGSALTNIKTVTRGTGVGTSGLVRTHRKGAEVIITDHVALKRMLDVLDGTTSLDSATPLSYDGTATISTANQLATKAYVDGVAIAGAADSSTTVKGITKMSVAPVSASSPIAVGDNDTRVPTQGENDALVGTSGTPSSSNKYVTNADTTGTGSVVRSSKLIYPELGNGSDGTLTFDGTTTILGMVPSANVYTLTKDIYGTTITINNSITIETGGYRIFATIEIINNGIIKRSPNNGAVGGLAGGTGGAALSSGTIYGGLAGGNGALARNFGSGSTTGLSGSSGSSQTESIGSAGAAGGAGGSDNAGHSGGSGGAAGSVTLSVQTINNVIFAVSMREFQGELIKYIKASAASGGGGEGGLLNGGITGGGGGGGSTGGIVFIAAKTITNNGTISANGGNGGNGSNGTSTSGGGGGGGGGNGGVVVLIYNSITTGTITVTGGTGGTAGTGGGTGASGINGSNGSTGSIISITI